VLDKPTIHLIYLPFINAYPLYVNSIHLEKKVLHHKNSTHISDLMTFFFGKLFEFLFQFKFSPSFLIDFAYFSGGIFLIWQF